MTKKLVIVESPSKAKTIKKYLGGDYLVIASQGHIIDLPASRFGVDTENSFKPEYIKIKGKASIIKEIKKEALNSNKIFLATDPDREGEAIAWHLRNELKIDDNEKCRIEFNEITESAVKAAVKKARTIDINLVDAQQARRILDRIVGYKISPLLWKKVKRGLSAGRVQSVTLRIIIDREEEIRNFVKEEYWTLNVILITKDKIKFKAKFTGDKKGKIELKDKSTIDNIISNIDGKKYIVSDIKKSEKTKNPPPPFITSSLQQEASRKLGFSVKKTMMVSQKLYEMGYITYMRTDSYRVSDEAVLMAKEHIEKEFGEKYYLNRKYKTSKKAQDAHEAIRPTKLSNFKTVISTLDKDSQRLYSLIFNRFVASNMAAAIYDQTKVLIDVNGYLFQTIGSLIKFDGFLKIYGSNKKKNDEEKEENEIDDLDEINELPDLEIGEELKQHKLESEQKFTEPPARYTEASLVKVMEEKGVGRPSTYAPTISTILDRIYVEKEGKYLVPTDLGEVVNKVMKDNFTDIVDIKFTANMEEKLDNIAEGQENYIKMLELFYTPFIKNLEEVANNLQKVELKEEVSDVICDLCGKNMVVKHGRFGTFLACPGYPDCKNTKPIITYIQEACPNCGKRVMARKSKAKRTFYICENNTNDDKKTCDYISWNKPGKEVKKTTKKTSKSKK